MAHSIQEYKGKSATFDDADLLAVIGFAIDLADRSPRFEKIRNMINDWRASLPGYGPGVIELNLDQIAEDPKALRELKELLELIQQKISQYHDKIPAAVLNEELGLKEPTRIVFYDYKISFVKEAVEKIEALIGE